MIDYSSKGSLLFFSSAAWFAYRHSRSSPTTGKLPPKKIKQIEDVSPKCFSWDPTVSVTPAVGSSGIAADAPTTTCAQFREAVHKNSSKPALALRRKDKVSCVQWCAG